MKKNLLLCFLIAFFAVSFTSCGSKNAAVEKLEATAKAANKLLPMNLGSGMKMKSINFTDGTLVYTVECMEVTCGRDFIPTLEEHKDELKDQMASGIVNGNPDMKKMAELCKEANASVEIKYVGVPSHKSVSIVLTPEEL